MAATIAEWDGNMEPIEDPTFGELQFFLVEWDINLIYKANYTLLQSKICDETDFYSDSN